MNWLKKVIGESAEMPEAPTAEAPVEAALDDAGDEAVAPEGSSPVSSIVQTLVSSWRSGNKIDVASRLLHEPISYADYARLMFAIGEHESVELGHVLDELSEIEPESVSGTDEEVMEPLDVRAALQGDER